MYVLLISLLSVLPLPFEGKITPELQEQLAAVDKYEKIEIIVHLRECYPYDEVKHLAIPDRARVFQNIAHASQEPLVEYLEQYPEDVADIKQFWIFNGMYIKATKTTVEEISQRHDVWYISANSMITLPPVEEGEEIPKRAVEWNIQKVMADSCWAAGYTGEDIFIGHIDTGIDTSHPALAGNWSGKWLDVVNGLPYPYDDHGHGTHTAGILCGGDGLGPFTEDIGVAPGVKIIAAKPFSGSGTGQAFNISATMQWMAALKADSGFNVRAVSNSWGSSITTSVFYWSCCYTWLILDIFPVFAIGNTGPGSGTAGTPGNFPICIGIGATDSIDNIPDFSSRGPAPDQSPWNDTTCWYRPDWNLTKPDIVAPGVSIRSSIPDSSYRILRGTSMSCPHVAGAAAILCQANPDLTPTELYNLLLDNADEPPQGAPYPNNNYGWGRLNVWKALQAVIGVEEEERKVVKADFVLPTIVRGPLYLPKDQKATVFDISGREVSPPYLAPGVYFVKIDDKVKQKIVIVK